MAPRKNVKRVEEEPVEMAAEAGEVTPPKKKKTAAKQTETEDPKEVRLPRAAKNKKPVPVEVPVAPVKKPVKTKATVQKVNDVEEKTKKTRAKAPAKKVPSDTEELKETKPKKKSKKNAEDQPEKVNTSNGDQKTGAKSKTGAKKPEEKEPKPKRKPAKQPVGKVETVTESAPKVTKARSKNAVKTDKVEEEGNAVPPKRKGQKKVVDDAAATEKLIGKSVRAKKGAAVTEVVEEVEEPVVEEVEEPVVEAADDSEPSADIQDESVESTSETEENGFKEDVAENGNAVHEETEAEEPKETKKGKGRQATKKSKVAFKNKSLSTESTDGDVVNPGVDSLMVAELSSELRVFS